MLQPARPTSSQSTLPLSPDLRFRLNAALGTIGSAAIAFNRRLRLDGDLVGGSGHEIEITAVGVVGTHAAKKREKAKRT
jgi:hypothetical protein